MGTLVITARSPLAGSADPPRRPRLRPWASARATRVFSAVTTRIPKPRASVRDRPGGTPRVVPARVLASGARTVASPGRTAVISRAASTDDEGDGDADEDDTSKLIVACAIGLATGLGVALFNVAEHATHDLVFVTTNLDPTRFQLEGERQAGPAADTLFQAFAAVAAPTAAGFLVTGMRFACGGFEGEEVPRAPRWRGLRSDRGRSEDDDDENEADDDASDADGTDGGFADGRDLARAAKPVLKAAAAVVTLGSGASLGPEGPSVEIGASVAGGVSELANVTSSAKTAQRLGLIAAGSAAGISAGFGAPIAGLFFAFESILQPAASRGSLPTRGGGGSTGFGPLTTESVILASVLAAVVSNQILGDTPAFVVPAFDIRAAAELPLYLPLGFLCGATAVAFRASSSALGNAFNALERGGGGRGGWGGVPREWHAPLGGFVFGLVALYFPEVTYQGFDNVNSILNAEGSAFRLPYPPFLLLELVLVKIASTALCRQSGLVGGVYAPSLFMGAALGSAYGAALVPLALAGVPVAAPQAYALVGMAGVLAGICRVPLTAILLLFELTHDYRIIVPLMGTVGVSSLVASAAERKMSMMSASAAAGTKSALDSLNRSFDEDELDRVSREAALERAAAEEDEYECAEEDEDIGLCEIRRDEDDAGETDLDAADEEALRSLRVADVLRRDVPRVSALASADDAATEARDAATRIRAGSSNGASLSCCAVVVDPASGTFVGVATAASLRGALDVMRRRCRGQGAEGGAKGLGPVKAADACDFSVPAVVSGSSLWEARRAMRESGASVCVVVAAAGSNARGVSVSQSDGDGFAVGVRALGVVEASSVELERESARLRKSLKLLRRTQETPAEGEDEDEDEEAGEGDSDAGEEARESRARDERAVR